MMNYRFTGLVLLAALVSCDAPPRSKEPAPPTAQEREAAASLSKRQAYELSERCGKSALEEFNRGWKESIVNTETGQMHASYTNHYNAKLNKCFYLLHVQHFNTKKSAGSEATMNRSLLLFDVHEGREFGNYFGAPTSVSKPIAGHPMICTMLDKQCSSEQEWEAFAKPYMEE